MQMEFECSSTLVDLRLCVRLFRSFILILDLIGKYMGKFRESIFVNQSLATSGDAHSKIVFESVISGKSRLVKYYRTSHPEIV